LLKKVKSLIRHCLLKAASDKGLYFFAISRLWQGKKGFTSYSIDTFFNASVRDTIENIVGCGPFAH